MLFRSIRTSREMIEKTILAEEYRFEAVLTEGLPRLEAELEKVSGTKSKVLSGEAAFRLYDTFGVPFDFIEDTAATQGVTVDKDGYERAMEGQRDKARAKSGFGSAKGAVSFDLALEGNAADFIQLADDFEGYTTTTLHTEVVAQWTSDGSPAAVLREGDAGYIALGATPFYLEAGGQVSDSGRIVNTATGASATVDGVVRVRP